MKVANVILGGYVNGYSIIQELYENNISDIYVIDIKKDISFYSNKINNYFIIKKDPNYILAIVNLLKKKYDLLIMYPNQDIYLEYLSILYNRINKFCFISFNPRNVVNYQDKMIQYKFCEKLGVPYPKTIHITRSSDLRKILYFLFPVLIKPTKRDNLKGDIFRSLKLDNRADFQKKQKVLNNYISKGFNFIASEIIPGSGSNVYAYVGYRNSEGRILGEWTGKKLSQFPDDFGVFSSASNQAPQIILEQGRRLIHGMDLWGINEPEFKFDKRDDKYKLTEINLRPMMWHRVGALAGVPLNYVQYLDAIESKIPSFSDEKNSIFHYVYLAHEMINLFRRKSYFKTFYYNIFSENKNYFAALEMRDLKPFLFCFLGILHRYKRYLKRNKNAFS